MSRLYKNRNRVIKPSSNLSKILILLTLAGLVLSGFFYATLMYDLEKETPIEKVSKYPKTYAKNLGKSPDFFKKEYPNLFLTHDRFGNSVAHFPFENAKYSIWFVAESGTERAFRIKIDKSYEGLKEKDITNHFAKLYGRTVDVQCDHKTSSSTQHCRYKWWIRNAVSLDLYSRLTPNRPLTVSAVTTDTYLAGKYHRKVKGFLPRE